VTGGAILPVLAWIALDALKADYLRLDTGCGNRGLDTQLAVYRDLTGGNSAVPAAFCKVTVRLLGKVI